MSLLAYAIIGILFILLLALLLRDKRLEEPTETVGETEYGPDLWDEKSLLLYERIFDPGDYSWLQDDLRFSHLARALVRSRKRLALRWLKAVRRSFEHEVLTPQMFPSGAETSTDFGRWRPLWLTLRFHFVWGYIFFMVRLFGPYCLLVPSFSWRHFIPELSSRRGPLRDG